MSVDLEHDELPKRLHLGCGNDVLPGWVNVDDIAGEGIDLLFDLNLCSRERMPFPDGYFVEMKMNHVLGRTLINGIPKVSRI